MTDNIIKDRFKLVFTNRDDAGLMAGLIYIPVTLVCSLLACGASNGLNGITVHENTVQFVLLGCLILAVIYIIVIRRHYYMDYESDDSSVTLYSPGVRVHIDFDDIRGICVMNYDKKNFFGKTFAVERLAVHTYNGLYIFDAKIDPSSAEDKPPLTKLKDHILDIRSGFIMAEEINTDPDMMPLGEYRIINDR